MCISGVRNSVKFEFQLRYKDKVTQAETLKDLPQPSSENITDFYKICITKRQLRQYKIFNSQGKHNNLKVYFDHL